MISLNDGLGGNAQLHGPTCLPVVEAACRIYLGHEDRELEAVAAEVGCEIGLLLDFCEALSLERADDKRSEEAA